MSDPLELCGDYLKFCETICMISSLEDALPEDALGIAVAALLMDELLPIGKSILAIGSFGDACVETAAQMIVDAGFTPSLVKARLRRAEELLAIVRERVAAKMS